MYSAKYLSHFQKPQNLGSIENPSATAYVEYKGKGCFDRINMTVKVTDHLVEDIRYQIRGCSGTIAACSALSSLVKGKSIDDIKQLSKDDIARELDGVPEQKQHSIELAMEALNNILDQIA